MAKQLSRSRFAWSMQHDRKLIALVKAKTPLQTIAKKLDRPVITIIRRQRGWGFRSSELQKRNRAKA
jgi:hypothetical protein